ncbi:MAG: hypothetical protein AAFQ64_15490 [Pseudomonadota bacterium]
MLKQCIALVGLIGLAACSTSLDGTYVARDYTGSLDGCPGLTGVSAIYSQTAAGLPVRCGPQAEAPVTYR